MPARPSTAVSRAAAAAPHRMLTAVLRCAGGEGEEGVRLSLSVHAAPSIAASKTAPLPSTAASRKALPSNAIVNKNVPLHTTAVKPRAPASKAAPALVPRGILTAVLHVEGEEGHERVKLTLKLHIASSSIAVSKAASFHSTAASRNAMPSSTAVSKTAPLRSSVTKPRPTASKAAQAVASNRMLTAVLHVEGAEGQEQVKLRLTTHTAAV